MTASPAEGAPLVGAAVRGPVPRIGQEAVDLCRRGAVAGPRSIVAAKQGRWWRVLSADLDERPEEWAEEVSEFDPFEDQVEEGVPF